MRGEQSSGAMTRAVQRHALWAPGARLVVAVSGGADSLCLSARCWRCVSGGIAALR